MPSPHDAPSVLLNPVPDNAPQTHLYLVRHGQAVINVTPIIGGPNGDTGLTPLGVRQAEALRDRLARTGEIRADVIIASTLPRARQTAEIIAPALHLAVTPDDDLHELRTGPDGDGLTIAEYTKRFGWIDIADNPLTPVDPGGESWASFMLRVATALDRIARDHAGKTVVVVTHGGLIDGSFLHFFGMNAHALPPARFHTSNTSLTHWERIPREGRLVWRLAYYNDASHARGLDAAGATSPIASQSAPAIEAAKAPV